MATNKTALITGATSGIGKAAAIKLASLAIDTVIIGRDQAKLKNTAEEITACGVNCLPIIADLRREVDTEKCVVEAIAKFGKLDILINAAGIIGTGSLETTSFEMWDAMMNINLRSVFHLMKLALPYLKKSKGTIVNVSSVTGLRAFPGVLSYCISKAGIDQLTRCTALELAASGIRVNAVNPGVVLTNLHKNGGMDEQAYSAFVEHSKTTHPLGRIGKPEEVAELIAFLATPQSSWITGTCISIDGGRAETCAR